MVQWIDYKAQQFPDDVQQLENYSRNGNNEFLAAVSHKVRKTTRHFTVPVNLWTSTNLREDWYWEIVGTDERVIPLKWALMPKPTED